MSLSDSRFGFPERPLRFQLTTFCCLLRACLEVVLWRRKWLILGSQEAHFLAHSSATGKKIAEMRFQKWAFAAQMTASKHALTLPPTHPEGSKITIIPQIISVGQRWCGDEDNRKLFLFVANVSIHHHQPPQLAAMSPFPHHITPSPPHFLTTSLPHHITPCPLSYSPG